MVQNFINKKCLQILNSTYMYKMNLALNNLQWLICQKTQLNQINYIEYSYIKRIWH